MCFRSGGVGLGARLKGRGRFFALPEVFFWLLAPALEGRLCLAEALLARGQGRLGAGLATGSDGCGVVGSGAGLEAVVGLFLFRRTSGKERVFFFERGVSKNIKETRR